jgi:RimJ/RimL family protein N-acetyltransferase
METNLLQGKLVRLTAEDPQTIADVEAYWGTDSEYLRLLSSTPAYPFSVKKIREWVEKELEGKNPTSFLFMIRTLADNHLIGMMDLGGDLFPHGEAWVGIGIGERGFWGQGYGTDAMKVILRYGFMELNLRRMSLNTFEYNPRAIRTYEKVGFVHEGRVRKYLLRAGQRWDMIFMGIHREEWVARNI